MKLVTKIQLVLFFIMTGLFVGITSIELTSDTKELHTVMAVLLLMCVSINLVVGINQLFSSEN